MADRQQPLYGIFFVRATLGLIGFMRALYDGFGAFGGPGVNGLVRYLENTNATAPTVMAYTAVAVELLCGLALIVGTFHRLAAVIIMVFLLTLAVVEGRTHSFFIEDRGIEYLLALFAMALCVFLAGPGKFAVDIKVEKAE